MQKIFIYVLTLQENVSAGLTWLSCSQKCYYAHGMQILY